jgi:hypothetical protein
MGARPGPALFLCALGARRARPDHAGAGGRRLDGSARRRSACSAPGWRRRFRRR